MGVRQRDGVEVPDAALGQDRQKGRFADPRVVAPPSAVHEQHALIRQRGQFLKRARRDLHLWA